MKKLGIRPAIVIVVAVFAGLVTASSALGSVPPPSEPLGCWSVVGSHSLTYCAAANSGTSGGPASQVLSDALARTGSTEAALTVVAVAALGAGFALRRRAARLQRARR